MIDHTHTTTNTTHTHIAHRISSFTSRLRRHSQGTFPFWSPGNWSQLIIKPNNHGRKAEDRGWYTPCYWPMLATILRLWFKLPLQSASLTFWALLYLSAHFSHTSFAGSHMLCMYFVQGSDKRTQLTVAPFWFGIHSGADREQGPCCSFVALLFACSNWIFHIRFFLVSILVFCGDMLKYLITSTGFTPSPAVPGEAVTSNHRLLLGHALYVCM